MKDMKFVVQVRQVFEETMTSLGYYHKSFRENAISFQTSSGTWGYFISFDYNKDEKTMHIRFSHLGFSGSISSFSFKDYFDYMNIKCDLNLSELHEDNVRENLMKLKEDSLKYIKDISLLKKKDYREIEKLKAH